MGGAASTAATPQASSSNTPARGGSRKGRSKRKGRSRPKQAEVPAQVEAWRLNNIREVDLKRRTVWSSHLFLNKEVLGRVRPPSSPELVSRLTDHRYRLIYEVEPFSLDDASPHEDDRLAHTGGSLEEGQKSGRIVYHTGRDMIVKSYGESSEVASVVATRRASMDEDGATYVDGLDARDFSGSVQGSPGPRRRSVRIPSVGSSLDLEEVAEARRPTGVTELVLPSRSRTNSSASALQRMLRRMSDECPAIAEEEEEEAWTPGAETDSMCLVCLDNPSTARFDPCGHSCVCMPCAFKVLAASPACPCCRADIEVLWQSFSKDGEYQPFSPLATARHAKSNVMRSSVMVLRPLSRAAMGFWRILDALRRFVHVEEYVGLAMNNLRVLLRLDDVRATVDAAAVRCVTIAGLVHRRSTSIARSTCATLRNIAWQADLRGIVRREGGLRCLIILMNEHPLLDDIQSQGQAALVNLSISEAPSFDPDTQREIIMASCRALCTSTHSTVCSSASYAIEALVCNPLWLSECVTHKAVPALLAVVQRFPEDSLLVRKSFMSLKRLKRTPDGKQQFQEYNGYQVFATMAKADPYLFDILDDEEDEDPIYDQLL